jgi:hypothetical protein
MVLTVPPFVLLQIMLHLWVSRGLAAQTAVAMRRLLATSSACSLQRKPLGGSLFVGRVREKERSMDKVPDHLRLVFVTSLKNYIYAGQAFQVVASLLFCSTAYVGYATPSGAVGQVVMGLELDSSAIPYFCAFILLHIAVTATCISYSPIRMYLDEDKEEYTVAFGHHLLPFVTRTWTFPARSAEEVKKNFLPWSGAMCVVAGRKLYVPMECFSTPLYYNKMLKSGASMREFEDKDEF